MKVDIDGEISLETPIEIEVLPKAIQLYFSRICKS